MIPTTNNPGPGTFLKQLVMVPEQAETVLDQSRNRLERSRTSPGTVPEEQGMVLNQPGTVLK